MRWLFLAVIVALGSSACAAGDSGATATSNPAMSSGRSGTVPTPPTGGAASISSDTPAERGVRKAREDLSRGVVQTLYIGELGPPGYVDRATGLPGESAGCEVDEEVSAHVTAYNRHVQAWVAANPPFPEDLVITYTVTDGDLHQTLRLTHSGASLREGSAERPVDLPLADRLRIGVLAQKLLRVQGGVPSTGRLGPRAWGLRVERGERYWGGDWGEGRQPPIDPDLQALLDRYRGR